MKKGDTVRVKSGTMDPDFEKFDMTNWQGRIVGIDASDETFIEIAWDSLTLDQLPSEFIESSMEEDYDFSLMWLSIDDVEASSERDTIKEVENKVSEINAKFGYLSPDEQEKNISKILNSKNLSVTKKNHDKYYDYLASHMKFPSIVTGSEDFSWEEPYLFGVFSKKEYEQLKKVRPSYTDHYELKGLEDMIDELRGILVKVKRISDKKNFVLPLWDLETVDKNDHNHTLISDYSFWMTNYR